MTASELLSGELAQAYRKGLDADPLGGSNTNYHDPRGPFVEFVKAAHQLAGESAPTKNAPENALVAQKFNVSGDG